MIKKLMKRRKNSARRHANLQQNVLEVNVQEQIDDYLTECQYHAELRKAIDDAARIGSAVIKGPFPVKRKRTGH
jgi:hypothetical protein